MKTLVLITSQFPFGTGESFIGPEFSMLTPAFEKVIIIAQNISEKKTRIVPDNVIIYRYNPSTSFSGFLWLPILFLLNCRTILNLLRGEVEFRRSIGDHLSTTNLLRLFKKVIKAVQLKNYIKNKLIKEDLKENIVFYSYWLKTGVHAIALLKYKDSIKIARAHGSDIYEEKTDSGYLPLLKFSAQKTDGIFFISNHGKEYFSNKVKIVSPRFNISRLGVNKPDSGIIKTDKPDKYVIVSCSNMVPLKRVDLIIYSLELVQSVKDISWLHFGDGILKNELEILAKKKLVPSNRITYSFMGNYPNDELLKYYSRNRVDLFINTSSTEGTPVSIMEAQSFGIPVIATDVGGVREVVTEGAGRLLPVDFRPEDMAMMIQFYANLPEEEENKIRLKTYENWKLNFNASSNYKDFIMKVNSILASAKE
ncbi:MAG: glycosyltransferase [Bacteroidota bacterium]